jgi:hypothetical protein
MTYQEMQQAEADRTMADCWDNLRIKYDDKGPDDYGRRRFSLEWTEPHGRKRGQCFFARPADILRGAHAEEVTP